MGENSSTFSFKKTPIAFLSSVILFFVSQAILMAQPAFWDFCRHYTLPIKDDSFRLEAQLRTISAEEVNKVFITGSSVSREGFDAELLNARAASYRAHFYNLAFSDEAPAEMFLVQERILSLKPDIVTYTMFLRSLYLPHYNYTKIPFYFEPRIVPYLSRYLPHEELKNWNYYVDYYLSRCSLFFKFRNTFRRITFLYLNNTLGIIKYRYRNYGYSRNRLKHHLVRFFDSGGPRFQITPYTNMQKALLKDVIYRYLSRGIQVIVIEAPVHPGMPSTYSKDIMEDYKMFKREVALIEGISFVPLGQMPTFEDADFIDEFHLNEKGRQKLSDFLFDYLQSNEYL